MSKMKKAARHYRATVHCRRCGGAVRGIDSGRFLAEKDPAGEPYAVYECDNCGKLATRRPLPPSVARCFAPAELVTIERLS